MELLKTPNRPKPYQSINRVFRPVIRFLSNPILAVTIAVLAWVFPNSFVSQYLWWLVVPVSISIIWALIEYFLSWRKYILELESQLKEILEVILKPSNIEPLGDKLDWSITGIEILEGELVLYFQDADEKIRLGSRLDIVVTASPERNVWGTIEVIRKAGRIATAGNFVSKSPGQSPVFWTQLLERANFDPTPPVGVHLEPHIIPELRSLLIHN